MSELKSTRPHGSAAPGDNTGANFWPLEVWQVTMTKGILIGD